jgi:alpha-glucosidase (family GH31 glycosyl hydrolase)
VSIPPTGLTDPSYYAHIYNKVVFDAIKAKTGPDSAALFARSATAGGQQFPVHWGGDCESTFEAMAETIRGGLSLTSSGFAFWSHDIGGFEGLPRESLYCRWVALGLWSSHVCLQAQSGHELMDSRDSMDLALIEFPGNMVMMPSRLPPR